MDLYPSNIQIWRDLAMNNVHFNHFSNEMSMIQLLQPTNDVLLTWAWDYQTDPTLLFSAKVIKNTIKRFEFSLLRSRRAQPVADRRHKCSFGMQSTSNLLRRCHGLVVLPICRVAAILAPDSKSVPFLEMAQSLPESFGCQTYSTCGILWKYDEICKII